jgi:hypothetical protein
MWKPHLGNESQQGLVKEENHSNLNFLKQVPTAGLCETEKDS